MRVKYLASLGMGLGLFCGSLPVRAADQTVPGAGNGAAVNLSNQSPLVQSAVKLIERGIARLRDPRLKSTTLDALTNPSTCVTHRANLSDSQKSALLQQLKNAGLVDPADDATFPGGLKAGVFPPLVNDGGPCPQLPQPLSSAPGSVFGGHHSYPGGLAVHEAFNEISDLNLASGYRRVYGNSGPKGLPVVKPSDEPAENGQSADFFISPDIITAAPLWHDWAKTMVFQWNSDGTEFKELNFGGNGTRDNYVAAGRVVTHGW